MPTQKVKAIEAVPSCPSAATAPASADAPRFETQFSEELPHLPSIEEAVCQFEDVLGVAPECDFKPLHGTRKLEELYDSIKQYGISHPVILAADNKVLDGRHRLVVCAALGIQPEFSFVRDQHSLDYVLADTVRRSYDTAQLAWMALELEKFVRRYCQEMKDQNGRALGVEKRCPEDTQIPLHGGMTFLVKAGETIRRAAIRRAGSSPSAVRRLTTVLNQDRELAQRTIRGEITLREAERQLREVRQPAGNRKAEGAAAVPKGAQSVADKKRPKRVKSGSPRKPPKLANVEPEPVTPRGEIDSGRSVPQQRGESIREREIDGGLTQFSRGDRTAILIPERNFQGKTAVRVMFTDDSEMRLIRVESLRKARAIIEKRLNSAA